MQTRFSILLMTAGVGLLILSTGCTCDAVYPVEVGGECPTVGDEGCEATASLDILVCVAGHTWQVETACDDFGMLCDESEGAPICVAAPCSPGQTRCTTDYSQVIVCNDAGDWTPAELCEGTDVCVVADDAAQCAPDSCEEGQTRCSADDLQVETCDADSQWAVTDTCESGEVCEVRALVARCVRLPSCSAATELDQRCDPDDVLWIQECRNVGTEEAPIYEWVDITDCSTMSPDYVCQQDGDNAPFCFALP